MKLKFLGTRGYIEASIPRHACHSSLEVSYRGKRVMIDCGEDWRENIFALRPHAIFLTHAHEDHSHGLMDGAPCPVYATAETWEHLERFPIEDRRTVHPGEPLEVCGIRFEAFEVQHSLRAPAVGYRITAGRPAVFYVPDLVFIRQRAIALRGIRLYIGDGATVTRPMVRRQEDQPIGHTPIPTQLTWCQKEGVPKMIITHCGTEVVTGEDKGIMDKISALARERGVEAEIAWDGMEIVLR